MPKSLPLYSSFSSGEISPRLSARSDIEAYKNGCARLENMISTSHGPVITRHGGKMIGWDEPVSGQSKAIDGRVFGFSITKTLGTFIAVILMDDGTTLIKPYAPNGFIIPPNIELVTNPRFESGSTGWTDISEGTGQVSFPGGTSIIKPDTPTGAIDYFGLWTSDAAIPSSDGMLNLSPTLIQIAKTSNDSSDFNMSLSDLRAGDPLRVEETANTSRWTLYTVTGTPTDDGFYLSIPVTESSTGQDVRNGQIINVRYTSTTMVVNNAGIQQNVSGTVNGNNITLSITCLDNAGLLTVRVGSTAGATDIYTLTTLSKVIDVEFPNTGGTDIWIDLFCAEGDPLRTVDKVSLYDSTINDPIDAPVEFVGPWTAEDIPNLQADSPPEGDILYISSPFTPVQKISYDRPTQGWTFEAVTFVDPPTEWVTGNYPRAITFYQGRMWLGGSPNEKERFWASKSADIETFTQGALDDDGLDFTISEQGEIEWVTGARNLIIGTSNGEHIVESAGGVITPSDIEIKQQSAYGSQAVQAEKIGQKILYVSPDGRKVREIGYQWTDDGWISRDISFASEHITADNSITEIAFAQNPENLLWCRTSKGNMVCCTYEKTYNVIGWHRHHTNGSYLSIASIDLEGSSYIGMLVLRQVNGEDRLFFETLDPTEPYIQDSWKYTFSDIPTAIITDMKHLAGQRVSVLTDQGTHPDIDIDSNGVGYLQSEHNETVVGYRYKAKMVTLSTEVIGNEGATYAMNKRWNKIFVRVLDSVKPTINGVRPSERLPSTPMNTPELPRDEDILVTDLDNKRDNRITIEQDLPLPLTIVGIFGEQNRENL